MSFDRKYKHRKDWRKSYQKKHPDRSCRPHGSCGYCRSNRLHSQAKADSASLVSIQDFCIETQPHRQEPPRAIAQPKKRWGIEFYAVWFGSWKIHKWYSTEAERDQALSHLQQSKAVDRNGHPLRFRTTKR